MKQILLLATLGATLGVAAPGAEHRAFGDSLTRGSAVAEDSTTTSFEVNGLHVVLRRNVASDVVAANLYLLGGTQQLTPENQGIESLLLASSERGTQHYPGAKARTLIARLGSQVSIDPTPDWTTFGLKCIRTTFDSTWAIWADRLMHPTLAPEDVELVRSQMLVAITGRESDPDALVNDLADSLEFAGEQYGLDPEGTDTSLPHLTATALREYQQRTFVTSRMLLVVVGNVERPTIEALVRATLGTLPRGTYTWQPPQPVGGQTRALVVREMQLPTNYILGYYAGPPASSKDYLALQLATAVLSGRFFEEIRSKRNLSYAPDAPFVERAIATGGVYVTTVDPNTTLNLMHQEIEDLKTDEIDPKGLAELVGQFITDYFLKNETNGDQANFLARAAIYQGDYRVADGFVDALHRVKPADIQRVAQQYIHNFRFVYVGDPSKLDRSILDGF
jgi:zinc protease